MTPCAYFFEACSSTAIYTWDKPLAGPRCFFGVPTRGGNENIYTPFA